MTPTSLRSRSLQWIFFFPFICQTAIAIAVTFVVLPETLAHQFM